MDTTKTVLFVCVENSNRSQMAEAFARIHGAGQVEAYSAGSRPSGRVNPKAVEAMKEVGYDLTTHTSKALDDFNGQEFDVAVTMGCGDECPLVRRQAAGGLADPRPEGHAARAVPRGPRPDRAEGEGVAGDVVAEPPGRRNEEIEMSDDIKEAVKSKYGAVATSGLSSDHAGVRAVAEAFGYTPEELASIPAEANMGLSCGNPTATASLRPGEVVVDLGCGGGLDVLLAAKKVGPTGKAIGIDMTPEMLDLARQNAEKAGASRWGC